MTVKRTELPRYVHRYEVRGIWALAKALERDYSNVHADVQALIVAGLLENADGRLRANYDVIEARIPILL
jgi:predicted transcriptional regulator